MSPQEKYQKVKETIQETALSVGRDPAEIQLVAVSKGYAWDHIQPVYRQGCRDFGESRVQELEIKQQQAFEDIRWHFIGTLQKNKVRKIIGKCVLIHSVDSLDLAQKISACGEESGIKVSILLEANTSGEQSKHGASPEQWKRDFALISKLPALQIEGLMTMAPLVENEKVIRACFSGLRTLRDELGLIHLSMGMSHDYRIAIEEGATLLRIGTALFNH
jgi:pyridoxal phosphate enzyme (YggS family)